MISGVKKIIVLLLILLPSIATAKHIMGGDITMKHLGNKGEYEFTLSVFVDNTEAKNDEFETSTYLRVYTSNGGTIVEGIPLKLVLLRDLVYDNKACQQFYGFKASEFKYVGRFTFNEYYNDDRGYAIIWQRCCRNNITRNIDVSDPNGVGTMFYLQTKAFFDKNGKEFINSTPDFKTPNGSFVCVKDAFNMNMGATDIDEDELRYSLVTPYKGYSSVDLLEGSLYDFVDLNNPPLVQWQPGFSATTAIPGSQPLTINSKTGEIKTTSSEVGFFAFSVLVEEFRAGVRISAARRDFQIAIIDCPNYKPNSPTLLIQNQVIPKVFGCPGTVFDLSFTLPDDNLNYQWQKNGDNIYGAISQNYSANSEGSYVVVATYKNQCARKALSNEIQVENVKLPRIKILPKPIEFCEGETVEIAVKDSVDNRYQWFKNRQVITGANSFSQKINEAAEYIIQVKDKSFDCLRSDTLIAKTFINPEVTILAKEIDVCKENIVDLNADILVASTGKYTYQWFLDNQVIPNATTNTLQNSKKGNYQIKITDDNNCKAESPTILINEKPSGTIVFDSINVICGTTNKPITLMVKPSGGIFTGAGINGSTFDPAIAGLGSFPIQYEVKGDNGCLGTSKRMIVVEEPIKIEIQPVFRMNKGESIKLTNKVNRQNLLFEWLPSDYLDNPLIQIPITNPPYIQEYTIKAHSLLGCEAQAKTTIYPESRLYIPNIFTPNGDGQNDTWEIANIKTFTTSEIIIYNRWGEVVFYSKGYEKPFDGKYNGGQELPSGVYAYSILAEGLEKQVYKGSLTLIR